MSPSSKKFKKRSSSKAVKPPQEDNDLSSLPDDIVLNCLQRVPRSYYLNLSRVSKTLRSFVRSPELYRLRSLLPKDSVYVSISQTRDDAPYKIYHWFTLEKKKMKTAMKTLGYRLVPVSIPFPSHRCMYNSSAVTVGSEIYFIGGFKKPSSDLWILDTQTGKLTQGPSMKIARTFQASVGVINGKIYVIGGCVGKIQAEVFDPKSRSWKTAKNPEEKWQCGLMLSRLCTVSLDWKVYSTVELGRIGVYDPREGIRNEALEMPSDVVWCMCVVDDVIYGFYFQKGLMWFDVKRKVWAKVIGVKGLDAKFDDVALMTEYDGKLVILWCELNHPIHPTTKEIRCVVMALDWVGEEIRGTIEWSGIVATLPNHLYEFHNCFVVSDDSSEKLVKSL